VGKQFQSAEISEDSHGEKTIFQKCAWVHGKVTAVIRTIAGHDEPATEFHGAQSPLESAAPTLQRLLTSKRVSVGFMDRAIERKPDRSLRAGKRETHSAPERTKPATLDLLPDWKELRVNANASRLKEIITPVGNANVDLAKAT
jgi:hypothetical protein